MPKCPNFFSEGIYDENTNGHYDGNDNCSSKAFCFWTGMLERCYSQKLKQKHPTYIGCTCCSEWKYYSNFKKWFNENYYEFENCKYEMNLDKDILSIYL